MNPSKRVHSFSDDILSDHDATALAQLIKDKKITSAEIMDATIQRAEQVEPQLNALMTQNFEAARQVAQQHSGEGFFAGLPMVYKDLTLIKGTKTFYGSEAFRNATPSKKTDAIVKQIEAQGFIHMGTTTTPEFGFTPSVEFPHRVATSNPWNYDHTCGGSSGGAAALVAAGVLPIAHSADGGGSTRIPAACCGLVGLKATRGRLKLSSLFEHQIHSIAIDGVITRTVRDTARFYAEAETYYHNTSLQAIGLVDQPLNKKLTIGYATSGAQDNHSDEPTLAAVDKTIKLLESLGHTVKPVELPITDKAMDEFIYLWQLNGYLMKKFGKQMFPKYFEPDKLTKLVRGLAEAFKPNKLKTPSFLYHLKRSKHVFRKFMTEEKLDALMTPTLTHLTPKIGHLGMEQEFDVVFPRMSKWACISPYANATGCPAISLPLAHDDEHDLPIGIMFGALHGHERLLLELAMQLEEAQPWKKIFN